MRDQQVGSGRDLLQVSIVPIAVTAERDAFAANLDQERQGRDLRVPPEPRTCTETPFAGQALEGPASASAAWSIDPKAKTSVAKVREVIIK